MQIQLTGAECSLLLELVENYYGELRTEIRRTDNPQYKKELKGREELLMEVLPKLRAVAISAPAT
jgi:hypothetical protein